MNLSSLAGVVGAGFGGYAEDQKEKLRRAMLDRALSTQDEDRLNSAIGKGWQPVDPTAPPVTGQALDAAGRASGTGMGGPGWAQALQSASAPTPGTPRMTVTTAKGPQSLAFNYESSQQGQEQTRQQNVEAQRERARVDQESRKVAEAAKQRIDQAHADYVTFRAEFPKHPLASAPFDPAQHANYKSALDSQRQMRQTEAGQSRQQWMPAGTDPKSGLPLILNQRTGETKEGGGVRSPAASGMSGMGQAAQARLLGAVAEARTADERMTQYEDKMLKNPEEATPGFGNQLGGKLATRLSGTHSLTGIIGETVGESQTDPAYLQYVRDAGLMARATQLMSSRGGSEAMVSAEQLLNRAVPNPAGLQGSVTAARKSRSAIFGPVGGLMQALSPEQIAKVNAGLDALHKNDAAFDYKGVGSIFDAARGAGGGSGAGGKTLTQAEAQKLGPATTAALVAKGYTVVP